MSYEFYKTIHILGIMILFFGLGGAITTLYGGNRLEGKSKKMAFMTHGIGLLLIFVAGFGMAAKRGYFTQLPTWIHIKILIWVLLGAGIAVVKRKGHIGWPLAILFLGLGVTSAYLAIFKLL